MNAMQLGIDVTRLRKKSGLTQSELAKRAGTTQAAISRLETGVKVPGYEVLGRIAEEVGNFVVVFGQAKPVGREERRKRAKAVLGEFQFNPWDRDPSPAEARSLIADGFDREYFASA